jgi:DNA-directed RNA polymerase specialized sigma24 family protein
MGEVMSTEGTQNQDFLLIQRIIRQDRAALAILYDRYAQAVYAVAYRRLGSAEKSEELVVNIFAKIWILAAFYDPYKVRVDGWIFMLIHNQVLKQCTNVIENIDPSSDPPTN